MDLADCDTCLVSDVLVLVDPRKEPLQQHVCQPSIGKGHVAIPKNSQVGAQQIGCVLAHEFKWNDGSHAFGTQLGDDEFGVLGFEALPNELPFPT